MLTNGIYLMLLSKGCESITREQINSWEFSSMVSEAKKAIPKSVAEAWLNAYKKGALPSWCISQVKVSMMELAAL